MVRFFAAGNPAIEEDSLALRLAEYLEDFEHLVNPLHLLEITEPAVILDVAKGIDEVQWIHANESEQLQRDRRMTSLHDFDLQFVLNMGSALEELPDIWILAVPIEFSLQEALPEVKAALRSPPTKPTSPRGSGKRKRSKGRKRG